MENHEKGTNQEVGTTAPVALNNPTTSVLKFFGFSLTGIAFFFIPIFEGGTPLAVLLSVVKSAMADVLPFLVVAFSIALLAVTPFVKKSPFLEKYMGKDGPSSKLLYLFSAIFGIMILLGLGPDWMLHADTGGLALDLAVSVLVTVAFAGFVVSFIACYGLLEFVGTLLEPIMRPLYKLPGYAAVDIATSITCSAAVDVFLANKIYLNKQYTKRDVSVVVSNFTICSLGFFLLLCEITGITEHYGLVVLTSFVICFIMSIIMVRIPPLSLIPNEYVDGTPFTGEVKVKDGRNIIKKAWDTALVAADAASPKLILNGIVESCFFAVKTCTYVLSIATVALIIGTYTPVFHWIGVPIAPLLELMQIPNAAEVAPAVLVGITEIAMPALLIAGKGVAPAACFFVVVLSTVQVIFFTESANAIMESDIPMGFGKLVVTFLLRTVVALPLVAIAMHLFF